MELKSLYATHGIACVLRENKPRIEQEAMNTNMLPSGGNSTFSSARPSSARANMQHLFLLWDTQRLNTTITILVPEISLCANCEVHFRSHPLLRDCCSKERKSSFLSFCKRPIASSITRGIMRRTARFASWARREMILTRIHAYVRLYIYILYIICVAMHLRVELKKYVPETSW